MRTIPLWIATAATFTTLGLPLVAAAHTGGALDAEGCHPDHRTGTYHCHRGEAAGYTFPNRTAMQEAVRTGNFPEKSVEAEGFFSKLWPFGSKHEQQAEPEKAETAEDAATGSADGKPAASVSGAAPAAPTEVAPGASAPAGVSDSAAPSVPVAPEASMSPPAAAAPAAAAAPQSEHEKRLKVLQGLYEMGLITKEEYDAKRKEVLDQL